MQGCSVRTFQGVLVPIGNGDTLTCDYVAHQYGESDVTTWSVLEVFLAVYRDSKCAVDTHQILRCHRLPLTALLLRVGCCYDDLVHPSKRAVMSAIRLGGSMPCSRLTRDVWTAHTEFLLAFLCHAAVNSKKFKLRVGVTSASSRGL